MSGAGPHSFRPYYVSLGELYNRSKSYPVQYYVRTQLRRIRNRNPKIIQHIYNTYKEAEAAKKLVEEEIDAADVFRDSNMAKNKRAAQVKRYGVERG
jgi:tRNA(Ile)-lysidine synthase TilS/MesJ